MAILKIKKFNEPVLRKKCEKVHPVKSASPSKIVPKEILPGQGGAKQFNGVKKIDKKIKKLIVDMAQTMKRNQGAGLAASQVGVSKRVIVVQGLRILGLVNPKITKKSKEAEIEEEGCLSFPGIFLKIKRAKEIEVEGQDFNGKGIKLKAKGLLAGVFQHEIDHLDGILFFNRLNFLQKIIFKLKHPSIKTWI